MFTKSKNIMASIEFQSYSYSTDELEKKVTKMHWLVEILLR